MATVMITFPTYSAAATAHDLLRNEAIYSELTRTPPQIGHKCGYSIKIAASDKNKSAAVLSRNNMIGEQILML